LGPQYRRLTLVSGVMMLTRKAKVESVTRLMDMAAFNVI
jgi:hypothetical protein